MAKTSEFTRSFAGGEISPSMFGRLDDNKFQTGAATMRNFVATPQGPAQNRAGFAYVNATKTSGVARLVPFTYSSTQTLVLEFGNQYIRFHTMGATVLGTGAAPYEVATPYAVGDVFAIHYVQSADVMTLVHPSYPPMELRRMGATNWTLTAITFAPTVAAPLFVSVTPSPGYLAKITAVSVATPVLITTAASHTLSLGDPIYINGLIGHGSVGIVDLSGFYLVQSVPVDSSGNLIKNQLTVMNYSGASLDAGALTSFTFSPGTIQYATKVFDPVAHYAVSALDATSAMQGPLSLEATGLNDLDVPGSYNVIVWGGVVGATNYYVFKKKNGLWGYIGQANGTQFIDNNIAPDFSITPSNPTNPFTGGGNYPAAVGYIEQRRCFGGTNNSPQTLYMTNSGTESTFSYSLPGQDTDQVVVKIAAREVSKIQHIVPLQQLVLLTDSCEYAEYTASGGPITPSSIGIRPQSYVGSSTVQPTVVNNLLVYCAARGGHVREMGYQLQSNGYLTGDLSLRAAHLFDNLTIVDQAYSKSPMPLLWFVSSSGQLIGFTYVPEEQIGAWHHHDTVGGAFESVTCVAEGNEERLYAVVRRTISGNTVRYIERMASRVVGNQQDCFFVDAGATYSGAPTATLSGLVWLEGQTVAVLADGAVQPNKTVVSGSITLDHAASVVQVGLPITADLQTLPLTMMVPGYGQGMTKNLNKVSLGVYRSSGIFVGPSADLLTEAKIRTTEPYGTPPSLQSGMSDPIVITPSWNETGSLLIRQSYPLPLTVVSVTLEVSGGG